MYDIEELEKKWLRYRRRKIIVIASSVILVTSIIGGVSYLVFTLGSGSKADDSIQIKKHKIATDKDIIVKREEPIHTINSEVPSMQSRTNGVDSTQKQYDVVNTPMRGREKDGVIESSEVISQARKVPKLNMIISEPESGSVIKEIEDRFRTSRNYDDAIYLAEYYYSHKNYKKAEYWAMQANIVDSIPEESWMIFAKAKVKSGHRVEALKVLEAYYNKTGSTNALDLIDTIRKNKSF